jgi:hypothetical protein
MVISALHSLLSIVFTVGLAQLSAAHFQSNLSLICFQLYAACFHSNLSLVWPSSMQFAFYWICHWHGSTLELVYFNSFEFVTGLAQLYVVCFRSILSLVWLSSLQFVFNRSCHWFGSALCRLLQSICHWFGSALCSFFSIDIVIGLAQLSVGCFQSILSLFWLAKGRKVIDRVDRREREIDLSETEC